MTDTPEQPAPAAAEPGPLVDDPAGDEPGDVDVDLDTTGGERDPLSTDDGLAEIAETMPEVAERDGEVIGEDAQEPEGRARLTEPELDVDADGNDPLAGLAGCDDEG